MRSAIIAAVIALTIPAAATAQPPAKFEKVRVGFQPYNQAAGFGRYKVGLWTPVYVTLTAGPNGLAARQGDKPAYLQIQTSDFEDVGTIYRTPIRIEPNETTTFTTYTKIGTGGDIKVELHVGSRTYYPPAERDQPMDLNGHVYLALGRRIADLPTALLKRDGKDQDKDKDKDKDKDDVQFAIGRLRAALVEDDADLLPTHWFGYDGVDLVFLSTDDSKFLTKLADRDHADQLKALAQWVRRGGRLIVPVSKQTQDRLVNVLKQGAWQPPIPVIPPAETSEKFAPPEQLGGLAAFANVQNPLPSPGEKAPVIAQLEPAKFVAGNWEVDVRAAQDGVPLIARVKYGMGQIIYLAFSFDDPRMTAWPGQHPFINEFIKKYAPKTGQNLQENKNFGFGGQPRQSGDITGQLYNSLDNFDVRVIPFGVVAVFIVLYVVIVGPLEFVLLKYVFGRLEWTWITFPTVVIGVSVIAYFGAYAIKGQDLKINKVDIVDFDLRTDVDANGQPRLMRVQGQTFLMILSPRIQSYTVGIEPNPQFWGDEKPAKPLTADLVSWMARPDEGRFGGGGGQSFFRKPYYYGKGDPYDYAESVPSGITAVPIPVWMAKAFSASWEATCQTPPVVADLSYHQAPVGGKDIRISGTIRNNFPLPLVDAWLFYGDKCYRIEGGLPAGQGDNAIAKIALEDQHGGVPTQIWRDDPNVAGVRPNTSQGVYDPNSLIKQLLLHETLNPAGGIGNHSHRRLDFSWRLGQTHLNAQKDTRTREAILFARIHFQSGGAEELTTEPGAPLPTNLWLGALPESGGSRPSLNGNLNQDTYIRVILPVKPAGN
jgi:hypothetical protein